MYLSYSIEGDVYLHNGDIVIECASDEEAYEIMDEIRETW